MDFLLTILVVVQVLSALGVIVLVLLQHGKGADMGAAFGSGSSGSLFGATGAANFLSRTTAAMATVFLVSTLGLAFVTNKSPTAAKSIMEQPAGTSSIPASTAPAGAAGSIMEHSPSLPRLRKARPGHRPKFQGRISG